MSELYQETSRDILAFLLRRCTTAEDAADCLAETYRVAWEKRKRIPGGREARAWLFGVARNAAHEQRRSSERRAQTSHELATAAGNAYLATTPEDSAVASALAELSLLDQEIITMISADGLAPREVASILSLSPNVVRVRAHRARERLRALLTSDDDAQTLGSVETEIKKVPGCFRGTRP